MIADKLFCKSIFFGLCLIILLPRISDGFNDNAHQALSKRAVDPDLPNASQLNNFLKGVLGFEFPEGINQPVTSGLTVEALIAFGAVKEDYPASRVLNHFHDPTRHWNVAGFKGVELSSIVWSQLTFQQVGITRTWKTARDSYFNALTSTANSDRKLWYAETFRTLGHLIHHVQDAAVPAHTRDDSHLSLFGTELPDGDPFHFWADSDVGLARINSSQPLRFDPPLLNQANANQHAPVPLARITDSTDGNIGSLALVPGLNIGLAEYSNANFISKGTSRSTKYQSPRISQLQFDGVETGSDGELVRYARFQPGIGEQDYSIGRSSRMVWYVNGTDDVRDALDFNLDDNVYDDYGRKLFPYAIGYSAGLIDYFFRGRIELQDVRTTSATSVEVKVKNATPNEETGSGEMKAVVTFTSGSQQSYAVSSSQGVNLTGNPQDVTFNFSQSPIPSDAVNASVYVVYKGLLGLEEGAVMVGKCGVSSTTSLAAIDYPGAVDTWVYRINNCGQIVGAGRLGSGQGTVGFIADADGTIQQTIVYNGPLEPDGFSDVTEATDINNRGQVFGWYCCGTFGDRGFRWADGSSVPLSYPDSMTDHIYGANDAGDLVGVYHNSLGIIAGYVLYADGTSVNLGSDTPMDINNVGQYVGYSGPNIGPWHGFLRNPDGSFISINYPGATSTLALGINDLGQIVGYYLTSGTSHGFLRNPDGTFISFDYPGAAGTRPSGINDSGQIVGYYHDGAFKAHGFVGGIEDFVQ